MVSLGSGSTEIWKSWYCPGGIVPPVQSTSLTAVVKVPSSVVSGLARVTVCSVIVQPGTGLASTCAIGYCVGICSWSSTVFAFDSSLGTLKVSSAVAPWGSEVGLTVTWAEALAATARPARVRAPRVAVRRRAGTPKEDSMK